MSQKIFERYKVIDIDTHITEPPSVWTDRVASKWGNKVPHIRQVEGIQESETLIGFRVYSTYDLERLFSLGMD